MQQRKQRTKDIIAGKKTSQTTEGTKQKISRGRRRNYLSTQAPTLTKNQKANPKYDSRGTELWPIDHLFFKVYTLFDNMFVELYFDHYF